MKYTPQRQKEKRHFEQTVVNLVERLISPSGRLWTWAATGTARVSASFLQPLLRTQTEVPVQLVAGVLAMDEVAEPATDTSLATIESTTGFSEIRHG